MNGLTCPRCRSRDVRQLEKIPNVGYLESQKDDSIVVYGPHLQLLKSAAFSPERVPAAILLRCGRCRAVWPL